MVELNGFETTENDYFTIQCGPTFGWFSATRFDYNGA